MLLRVIYRLIKIRPGEAPEEKGGCHPSVRSFACFVLFLFVLFLVFVSVPSLRIL